MDQTIYSSFLDILKEELVPAMGCTEPIAVAYAAALARDTLGRMPEKTTLIVSGNIIKNVKSVVVPNTGGRKGLRTAVAAGLCFGDAKKELEVIADASEEDVRHLILYHPVHDAGGVLLQVSRFLLVVSAAVAARASWPARWVASTLRHAPTNSSLAVTCVSTIVTQTRKAFLRPSTS